MDDNLISKRELLEKTGISYGQLYRWKRKKLIPEEWFIKKSAFTGQETFFPRDEIFNRIDKILNLKDGHSLDEIADVLTVKGGDICVTEETILADGIVTEISLNIMKGLRDSKTFNTGDILAMYVFDKFIESGKVGIEEGKNILKSILNKKEVIIDKNYDIILYRKYGVAVTILIDTEEDYFCDEDTMMVHCENIKKNLVEVSSKTSGM